MVHPHVQAFAFLLGSHPMLIRAKVDIFKNSHLENLGVLGSFGLLSTLYVSTKIKKFKFATKNLIWLVAMDEKVKALQKIALGFWSLDLQTPTFWDPNKCFRLNIYLMALLSVSKLTLLPRAMHRYLFLTTLTILSYYEGYHCLCCAFYYCDQQMASLSIWCQECIPQWYSQWKCLYGILILASLIILP